jgi:hypothetical protein
MKVQIQQKNTWSINGASPTGSHWMDINPPKNWPRNEWEAKQIKEYEEAYQSTGDVRSLERLLDYRKEWYGGRNYDLFGILADVRNGSGFAGCVTGSGWPSIAPDRGLPEGEKNYDDEYGDHSFTWMTLQELIDYDWKGTIVTKYGVVQEKDYIPGQKPTAYSGGVMGMGVVTLDEKDLDGASVPVGTKVYVRQSWESSAEERCGIFVKLIEEWKKVADSYNVSYDQLRLVMGFDS